MLREFPHVRQTAEGFRRLFCDDQFDLYVWYQAPGGPWIGFQVVYYEDEAQKALTWTKDEGYRLNSVDGWDSSRFNLTPLLVPDGTLRAQALLDRLVPQMAEVDPEVRDLVVGRIQEFSR